jgi:osmotically-inducible protein OsmY
VYAVNSNERGFLFNLHTVEVEKKMSSKQSPKQRNPIDDVIQAAIWDTLRKDETIRSLDLGSLSIDVKGGEVYLTGYIPQENSLLLIESIVHSVVGVVEVHNHLRTNEGILADIWDALEKEDSIRSLDLGSLSIDVKDGEVYLDGHLAKENNLSHIEDIARSVTGVVAVHNYLVTDRELTIRVAQALAQDERTRPYIFPVSASHGWINLGGEVLTRELQHVAEKVAAGVSGVRGVIALPRVTGKNPNMPQPAVQPRIGAVVYGENGEAGVVTQVAIQPENRLVTHVVVSSNEIKDANFVSHENIVPVKAIDLVKDETILLVRNGPSFSNYPAFDPDEYPLALFTWKAPYPYTTGEVLWSLREILEAGSRPGSRPEIKPGEEIENLPERAMAHAGA